MRRIQNALRRLHSGQPASPSSPKAPSSPKTTTRPAGTGHASSGAFSTWQTLLRDDRFEGRRVLQRPLARHLRGAGWRFPLQGAWDPPAHPCCVDEAAGVRAELHLAERDPSELNSGGSCRWVTLGALEITGGSGPTEGTAAGGDEGEGTQRFVSVGEGEIQRLRETWIRQIEDGSRMQPGAEERPSPDDGPELGTN